MGASGTRVVLGLVLIWEDVQLTNIWGVQSCAIFTEQKIDEVCFDIISMRGSSDGKDVNCCKNLRLDTLFV